MRVGRHTTLESMILRPRRPQNVYQIQEHHVIMKKSLFFQFLSKIDIFSRMGNFKK